MKRLALGLGLLLLFIFSAMACADAPEVHDELSTVIQYIADNNMTFDDDEAGVHYYLRSAYVMDVAASREAMADSKYIDLFVENYGDFEHVYFMEYVYTLGADPLPNGYGIAVGVRADSTMESCLTFSAIRARTYDLDWCKGVVVENVLDRTLAEAMTE